MTHAHRYTPEAFNLERMRALMAHLGDPQTRYPSLHVAGTKGKGSVTALCAAALDAAGYRVGHYTSPHLHDYTERIRVAGQPIPRADFVRLLDSLRPYLDAAKPTTFEITTALAFLYFAEQGVNAAVIEVGLGGRLDATNIIQPTVTAITSLSMDHMQFLGDTLAKIAAEKAGIVKPGVPLILAPQRAAAFETVAAIAAERGAPLLAVGREVDFTLGSHSLEGGQDLTVSLAGSDPLALHIPLLGAHQAENAAVAYAVLRTAAVRGLPLADAAIVRGFSAVRWPGRFELLRRRPDVVVDSAHNADSARRLRQALDDYFPDQPVTLVFGASEDKDISGMFAELLPRSVRLIVTRSFHPRAADPLNLIGLAAPWSLPTFEVDEVADALQAALAQVEPHGLVLVTGSIFVAAAAREILPSFPLAADQTAVSQEGQ
jgi:dihydrofolate synthase/folylpolyglutamate synthase